MVVMEWYDVKLVCDRFAGEGVGGQERGAGRGKGMRGSWHTWRPARLYQQERIYIQVLRSEVLFEY